MTVIVIEPPSPVVSVEEAKRHLRVDPDVSEFHALIAGFIDGATTWLDGPDGWLGRAIGGQVLEWQSDAWPCNPFTLPYPPLVEVISVTYVDTDGADQTWPFPTPLYFENMPAVRGRPGDVKIRYRAGYGSFDGGDPPVWVNAAPANIKNAIVMLVAHWFETREASTVGVTSTEVPFGVKALLATSRVYR